MKTALQVITELALQPHPEGGWYRELYRSPIRVHSQRGPRSALTTIYYLLERGQRSRWHVVEADEIWHFYGGDALELLAYEPQTRRFQRHLLCPLADGGEPVAVIRAGEWQAARTLGAYSLIGCSVGPGFEFDDFRFVADLDGHAAHFTGDLAAYASLL